MSMKEKLKVSLNSLKLEDKSMEKVIGASCSRCCCACLYKDTPTGSSTADNWWANRSGGLSSPGNLCDEV